MHLSLRSALASLGTLHSFADELEGADKVLVDNNGELTFGPVDLSFILEVASSVPNKIQRSITNLVSRLDSTLQIVLKVISVVGGGGILNF